MARRAALAALAFLLAAPACAHAAITGVTIERLTDPAYANQPVQVTATVRGDPAGLVEYRWNVDCTTAGAFPYSTGTAAAYEYTFGAAGTHSVCVQATDGAGHFEDAVSFAVTDRPDQPPVARLKVSPSPSALGAEITFDASASFDPENQPLRYRFDLDGEPGYEVDNGAEAVFRATFSRPFKAMVGVQVFDLGGLSSTVTQELVVADPPAPPPLRALITVPRQTIASVLARGLRLKVATGHPADLRITIDLVRGRGTRRLAIVHTRTPASAVRNVTRHLPSSSAAALRRLRRATLIVGALATDIDGVSRKGTKRVTLR